MVALSAHRDACRRRLATLRKRVAIRPRDQINVAGRSQKRHRSGCRAHLSSSRRTFATARMRLHDGAPPLQQYTCTLLATTAELTGDYKRFSPSTVTAAPYCERSRSRRLRFAQIHPCRCSTTAIGDLRPRGIGPPSQGLTGGKRGTCCGQRHNSGCHPSTPVYQITTTPIPVMISEKSAPHAHGHHCCDERSDRAME